MAKILVGGVFWAIVLGLPLGIAAVVSLLRRFRARITRSMRATAGQGIPSKAGKERPEIGTTVHPVRAQLENRLTLDIVLPEAVLRRVKTASGSGSPELTKRQARRTALVYGMAASAFALIMTVGFHSVFVSAFSLTRWKLLLLLAADFSALATPTVLATTYVLRKQVRYLVLSVLVLLAVVGLWDLAIFEGSVFNLWLLLSAAPTGVALLLATRRLRGVGPTFIVGIAVWSGIAVILTLVGIWFLLHFVGLQFNRPDLQEMSVADAMVKYAMELPHGSLKEKLTLLGGMLSHSQLAPVVTIKHPGRIDTSRVLAYSAATLLISCIAGAVAAWLCVSWLTSRYRRRRASDQMLAIDVMISLFALYSVFAFLYLFGEKRRVVGDACVLSILAFIAYKFVAAWGLRRLRKSRSPVPPRTLLLLRVFGFARRTQRLLEDLGQRWRYLGPIRLIAGPDLAYATIEPHEFYDFLGGHLSRAFIKDQDDLENRLSLETAVADRDSLFRIQDFFCHDDTWMMAVSHLAGHADAVFMDLRGFSPSNSGCIFEIRELVRCVPVDRIVILVDTTTDVMFLERTLSHAWRELPEGSPNMSVAQPVMRVLHGSRNHWRTLNALMVLLCAPFDDSGTSVTALPVSTAAC